MSNLTVSHAEVRARYDYNPANGIVTDKATGKSVGTLTADGYLMATVFGARVYLHRFAFFYMYGVWPKDQIDHVNGIRDDNRLINIRPATSAQNMLNRGVTTRSKSGYKGVYWDEKRQGWAARITVNGRSQAIRGTYRTAIDASRAYQRAAKEHHVEFARWEKHRPSQIVKPEPAQLVEGGPIPGLPTPRTTFKQRDWIIL
jgi:hypothetical protein